MKFLGGIFCGLLIVCVGVLSAGAQSAENDWFLAGFTGFYEEDESVGGYWYADNDESAEFLDRELKMNYTDEDEPVNFYAEESRDAANEDLVLTIESVMNCYGYDVLPAPPKVTERVKSAVVAKDDGNYFVLGYDGHGRTNCWYDTGVPAEFGKDVEVRVTFAFTNLENMVTYEFDGRRTRAFPVYSTEIDAVAFAGSGEVSRLNGESCAAPERVFITLPDYYGIDVYSENANMREYVGDRITLWFWSSYGYVTRDSAKYRVMKDGSLVFDDIGFPPELMAAEAAVNGTQYRSLAEAVAAAGSRGTVDLLTDVCLRSDVWYTAGRLNFNGHSINPELGSDYHLIIAKGSAPQFVDGDGCAYSINAELVVMSDLDFGSHGDLCSWKVTLGDVEAVVRSVGAMNNVVSGVAKCEVVRSASENRYVYSLSQVVPEYPDFIKDESSEVKSRFDSWADTHAIDRVNATADSYLLNCAPSEVSDEKAKFMIISIEPDGDTWTVLVTGDKGEGERYGNGYVHIKSVKDALKLDTKSGSDLFRAELLVSPPSK